MPDVSCLLSPHQGTPASCNSIIFKAITNNLYLAFKTMVMSTSHQPPCCYTTSSSDPGGNSCLRLSMEFWHSPTRFTTPSSTPRVNRSVLSKKRLPPIVLGISGQPYKLHLTLFSPRIVHVRPPEGLLASQLNLEILGKFHKLQLQTLLVSNYLQ
ncbi:hypothetical protein QL285_075654 [Trifolium repens]|nr:hypothetical protein QL285_075654 [Trifolium repens]